jgi:hypothetical protein
MAICLFRVIEFVSKSKQPKGQNKNQQAKKILSSISIMYGNKPISSDRICNDNFVSKSKQPKYFGPKNQNKGICMIKSIEYDFSR